MTAQKNERHFKILLGDDHSGHARAALAMLQEMDFPKGTQVTVFRSFTPSQSTDLLLMEDALNQTCSLLREKGWQAQPELLMGSPTSDFLKYAGEQAPDLIMMGALGLRSSAGILVGGVAQQVMEYAPCPVLLVRLPYESLRNVLLATDGSEASLQALHFLGGLPFPSSTRLWVMHVLPPPPLPMVTSPLGTIPVVLPVTQAEMDLRQREDELGQKLLEESVAELKTAGKKATSLLKRGDAATEIMAAVKELGVDLLVTGSRGLSPVRSWLLGSVSRKLLHYAGCSVLVVRKGVAD